MRSCNDMRGNPHDLPPPPVPPLDALSLFLDFDGTLVAIAPTPDAVSVEDPLRALLARLHARLAGRLVLLSGRALDDLRDRLGPFDGLAAGSHGLERSDEPVEADVPPLDAEARAALAALSDLHPGLLVEEKRFGLALHYRLAPTAEAAAHALAEDMAARRGWRVQPGKMVVEIRPPGADKGETLRAFMGRPEFAGTRPFMVGDDLTDEPAFAAARALGGAGVLVGARETAADYALGEVAAVRNWLERIAAQ
jgi:trehalose 6-phosphate phosphatase